MARLQVLESPPGHSAFGGLGTFQGLGPENEKQLFEICSFKYMGAAEYEWGVSPKIMYHIATNRDKYKLCEKIIFGKKFYLLLPTEALVNYTTKIEELCKSNYSHKWHGLKDVVEGKEKENGRDEPKGWIDIDEKLIFFIDEEMAKKMDSFLQIEEAS